MKTLSLSALLCSVLAAPAALAAETQKLDPVVSTAARVATPLDQTIGSATVITREDVERLQPRDIADLLRGIPGLAVAQSGGRGKQTSVFIRGNDARNLLVLINGRRAGTVELPNFSWESFPVDEIERIEIVPGARSSLYGSQAFGGVINIITRRDPQTVLRAGGGTQGSHDVSGHTGWANQTFDVAVSAGMERTTGYDSTTPANINANPDEDGFEAHRVGLHAGANLTKDLRLELDSLHNQGVNEFDGFGVNSNDFRLEQHRFGASYAFAERSKLLVDAGYNRDERRYDDGTFTESQRRSASAQLEQGFAGGSNVTGGFDFTQDRYDNGAQTQRLSRALFAAGLVRLGDFSVEAGARHERDDAYGDVTTGQAGLRYTLSPTASVFTRGGTAYRAPTFEERFGGPFNLPAPGLQPERGHSVEVGGTLHVAGTRNTLSVYRNDVSQLINANFTGFPGIYENIPGARMTGVEFQSTATWLGADFAAGLAYLDARNTTTHAVLLRRPHKSASLSVDRRFGPVDLGASLDVQGKSADVAGATNGGFGLLDLRAAYAVAPSLTFELAGYNVLDRDYATVDTFRGSPATVRAGVIWKPGQK